MFRNEILRLKEEYNDILQHIERFRETMDYAIKDAEVEHLTSSLRIFTKVCCETLNELDQKSFNDLENLKDE